MYWIVQSGLYSDPGMEELLHWLRRFELPHAVVEVTARGELSPDVQPEGPVMVCGSVRLARLARERGWTPGSFLNENHEHRAWVQHWGGRMLNAGAVCDRFEVVRPMADQVFVRPAFDNKLFSGQVLEAEDFRDWQRAILAEQPSPVPCSRFLTADTPVVLGPVAHIYREARVFVVDGQPVTWSTYRVGRDVVAQESLDEDALDFVREAVAVWTPARAFVFDVGLTDAGWRGIEVNCINSAGFYGGDVARFVAAIEAMTFEPTPNAAP